MKNKIKILREKLGLTQEQLGRLVETSRQAINAIETGKNEPSIWLAYDISRVFNEPIESVFLFEESERKSRAQISRGNIMALREIRRFDDEILRKKSKHVENVDNKIREILNDMADTMYNTPNGGGLAACQVGVLKRLVVIDLGDSLIKLVNPEIIKEEGEQIVVEGCLSFPETWGKLKRPKKVTVQALNEYGEKIEIKGSGLMAKCLCHEIDHLNGIVFTDKIIEYVKL